jgi:hypothetical protein
MSAAPLTVAEREEVEKVVAAFSKEQLTVLLELRASFRPGFAEIVMRRLIELVDGDRKDRARLPSEG